MRSRVRVTSTPILVQRTRSHGTRHYVRWLDTLKSGSWGGCHRRGSAASAIRASRYRTPSAALLATPPLSNRGAQAVPEPPSGSPGCSGTPKPPWAPAMSRHDRILGGPRAGFSLVSVPKTPASVPALGCLAHAPQGRLANHTTRRFPQRAPSALPALSPSAVCVQADGRAWSCQSLRRLTATRHEP